MTRLLTAAVAVPTLLYVVLKAPAAVLLALVAICGLVAYWELQRMLLAMGLTPTPIGYVTTLVLIASFYYPSVGFGDASLLALLALGVSCIVTSRPGRDQALSAMAAAFATFYVGALLGSVIGLRMLEPETDGRRWVIFALAVVMMGDAGAYYLGRAFGRRPLAPTLSPNKTVEGLVGGLVFSLAAALFLRNVWFEHVPVATVSAFGLGLSLLGVAGDLFESFLKRSAGVKDASAVIPGHGGVLDRLDSILFAAPGLFLGLRWLS